MRRRPRTAGGGSSPGVRVALDLAWGFGGEVRAGRPLITSATLWQALATMARRQMLPESATLSFLRCELAGRWSTFDRQRRPLALDEELETSVAPAVPSCWSRQAHRCVQLAQGLAAEETRDRTVRLRHLLRSILLQPSLPDRPSAHWSLMRLGLEPSALRRRFERAVPPG